MTAIEASAVPSLGRDHIHDAIKPLRFIFWGGLLAVIDFHISWSSTRSFNGQIVSASGFRFDIFNDAVAFIMITWAVFRLLKIPVGEGYRSAMIFVAAMSIYSLLEAIVNHFILIPPDFVNFITGLMSLAQLGAILVFCLAMQWLCEAAALRESRKLWFITFWMFLAIYVAPMGLLYVGGLLAVFTGSSFNFNFGLIGLLLILPLFIAPLIALFFATSKMIREAGSMEVGG